MFDNIVKETGLFFETDLCATDDNTKCMCYIDKEMDVLRRTAYNFKYHMKDEAYWCNPPRSMNGKFVDFCYKEVWNNGMFDVVMLLCWNDLGNKYGEKLLPHIINGDFVVQNLGKVKFYKNGKESEFVSRLTYFWCWMKSK